MNRVKFFIDEYIGITQMAEYTVDQQADLLYEMVNDLLLEERLRLINILDLRGVKLEEKEKTLILKGINHAV